LGRKRGGCEDKLWVCDHWGKNHFENRKGGKLPFLAGTDPGGQRGSGSDGGGHGGGKVPGSLLWPLCSCEKRSPKTHVSLEHTFERRGEYPTSNLTSVVQGRWAGDGRKTKLLFCAREPGGGWGVKRRSQGLVVMGKEIEDSNHFQREWRGGGGGSILV